MRILNAYLRKTFSSPITYLSIVAVAVITFTGMSSQTFRFGVIYPFDVMLDLSSYRKLIMLFAAIPFVSQFSAEWNANSANQIIVRSSQNKYISSHIAVSFLSALIVTFAGILLCVAVLCIKYPLYIDMGNNYSGAIDKLLNEKDVLLYLFFRVFHYSFSIAVWALSGLAVSAVFPNTFVAVCAPFVFSYVIEVLTIETAFLPDLWRLSLSYTAVSDNSFIASCYIVFIFSLLGALFSYAFVYFAKRRIRNEIH